MAAGRIIGLYEDNAAAWDRQRSRRLIERTWLERFCAGLPPGGHVLDIGCGMGEPIAASLIERGYVVTGVDSSPSLIRLCRERFPTLEWIVADMRAMELGRRFDGLLAWHSLFHLPPADQRPMFARFARHAASNARLMFTSGTEEGSAIGEWQGEPLYHGSLDTGEYGRLLGGAGFEVINHVVADPACGHCTVWLAQHKR